MTTSVSCTIVIDSKKIFSGISLVRGSGNIISEDRAVSGFNKISISGGGNIFVEQGDEESLTIKAAENILPLLTTEVSGSTLTIATKPGVIVVGIKSIEVHLAVKDLNNISATGSANINCSSLSSSNLTINTTGSGNIVMSNLKADSIDIDSTGSGNYTLAGKTDNLKISASGSGNHNAEELKSKECEIRNSGSGNLKVNASDVLDVFIGGSGNVYYIGNPTIDSSKGFGITGKIINISK